jgi:ABC-type Fe3+/spermidine/putrescine transport system ATPase subunit/ABC-type sulfate transport system permease component
VTPLLPAPLPWLAGLLAVYLLLPFIAAIPQVWLADWRSVDMAALGRASAVSVGSATLASALIALGGIPLGYLLARVPGRAVAALGFLVQLPLALPPLASGILLLFLLGYRSPLGRLTDGGLTDSFLGIVLAEMFVAAPFLIIAARSAFAAVDPVLEGVAATLGHGRLATFLRVSLPLAWPTTRSGLLLAWLRGFGEFGATVMVAYHPYSLPVYTYVAFGSQGLPAMLPVLLPALAAAITVMGLSSARTRRASTRGGNGAVPQTAPLVGRADWSSRHNRPRNDTAVPVDLAFQFQKQLNGFELDVAWSTRARRIAILGPSGSGKSLTLRLIAGLERPNSGALRLSGRDLLQVPPERRSIAYVPQNYGLFPHLTIAEHLRFPIGAVPDQAQHWLERLGLFDLKDRLPAALSLGQQQRVALARALVRPAGLMLLDEPFSALDAPLRARLRQAGPVESIFSRPANETVAYLLGAENVSEGIAVADNQIAIEGGAILLVAGPALQPGRRVGWSVRPERVRLCANGRYEATIESIATIGGARDVFVRLGGALLRILADPSWGIPANRCRLEIDPGAIQVWQLN